MGKGAWGGSFLTIGDGEYNHGFVASFLLEKIKPRWLDHPSRCRWKI